MSRSLSDHLEPILSVVLPCYNERENIDALLDRLRPVADAASHGRFEIIFVNDGSRDGSADALDAWSERDSRIKVLHLSRNFGHQAALCAGLDQSSGRAVVLMDADLQDEPEVIAEFVRLWHAGHDVVYAVRARRNEVFWKRAAYAIFYRTFRRIAGIDIPIDAGDFCLLDRSVTDVISGLDERDKFLRGLRSWAGFRQATVTCARPSRHAGTPKYTFTRLIRLALSGYIGFSAMPLRLSSWLGMASAVGGLLFGAAAAVAKIFGIYAPRGWASTVTIILVLGGLQLLMIGIIGEYLGRIYDEVRHRPQYIVSRSTGFVREKADRVRAAR
jgi:dolichol-phosphate mannosyltransferase